MKLRFSLRTFLLFATAAVLLLGYGQYRRQWILEVCDSLRSEGFIFDVPSAWHDRLWQRKPTVGTVFHRDGKELLWPIGFRSGADAYFALDDPAAIERLKNLGMVEYGTE